MKYLSDETTNNGSYFFYCYVNIVLILNYIKIRKYLLLINIIEIRTHQREL